MRPPVPPTRLQSALGCTIGCYDEWHEHLDADEWRLYVRALLERWTREAERLAVGEAIHAARKGADG